MNTFRQLARLPRAHWILALSILINRMGTMALPFLVLYLTRDLGFSAVHAGYFLSLYGVCGLLIAPIGGWLCDRWGAARVSILSLFLTGIVVLFFPYVHSVWGMVVIITLWSIVAEVYRPATMALAAEHAPPDLRRLAFALNRLTVNLAMAIGPALGGFLAEVSFKTLFFIDGITSLVGGVIVWGFFRNNRPENPNTEMPWQTMIASAKDRRLVYLLLALLPVNVVFFQHNSTLPLFMVHDLGLSESRYGMIFMLNGLMIMALELPIITRMAHWKLGPTATLASFLFASGFGILYFATNQFGVVLSTIVWTFGEMILFPAASAYVSEIAPEKKRGSYLGMYMMLFSMAFILGPWLGTLVYEKVGHFWIWPACFALGLVSCLFFLRLKDTTALK